jgi:hypothetical protein
METTKRPLGSSSPRQGERSCKGGLNMLIGTVTDGGTRSDSCMGIFALGGAHCSRPQSQNSPLPKPFRTPTIHRKPPPPHMHSKGGGTVPSDCTRHYEHEVQSSSTRAYNPCSPLIQYSCHAHTSQDISNLKKIQDIPKPSRQPPTTSTCPCAARIEAESNILTWPAHRSNMPTSNSPPHLAHTTLGRCPKTKP